MMGLQSEDKAAIQKIQEEARQHLKNCMEGRDSGAIEPLRAAIEAGRLKGLDDKVDLAPAMRLLSEFEQRQRFLTFTDVPREDMEEICRAKSRDDVKALLMRCMRISKEDGFQSEILAEFHFHNFAFCQKRKCSSEQTSTFLSIMRYLHKEAIVDQQLSIQAAFLLFRKLLDSHSVQRPPFSVGVFEPADRDAITDYVSETFFQHY